MTIVDPNKYRDAAWDWGILNGCFGDGRIRPSDIDGVVEKGGHFLFIEAKPPGKPLGKGQELLFEALASLSPKVTVLVLWGEKEQPTEMWHVGHPRRSCSLQDVREFCRAWYQKALATGWKR